MDEASDIGGHQPSFHAVAQALDLGMAFQILVEPDGATRFTYVGPCCLELNGVAAKDALADPRVLYDQILPEHRAAFEAAELAAMRTHSGFSMEVAMRHPDGEVRWRRIASSPRRRPDGSTLWDGLLTDITEARRAAAELEDQRQRLLAAVEAADLGFWEWDVRGGGLTWSDRNRELFDLAPGTPVSIERYMALVHPEDLTRVREIYVAALRRESGGDFSVEHRTAPAGGAPRWILAQGRVVRDGEGVKLMVGTSLDISKRKMSEERGSLLMGELAHRAKNGIAVMMSIVSQTARRAAGVKDFEEVLLARLQSMAASQDLVTASGGRPVALAEVVTRALSPFGLARFDLEDLGGQTIMGDVAVGLALLLHEMSTNALKYGALSVPEGRVRLGRLAAGEGRAALAWTERGGPQVKPPRRQGFGARVMDVALRDQGGKVAFDFAPQGFEAQMEFPTSL